MVKRLCVGICIGWQNCQASEMCAIVSMAYLWDAKVGKVSLGLADDCSCECILKFIDLYPIREVADGYQVIHLFMGTNVLAH